MKFQKSRDLFTVTFNSEKYVLKTVNCLNSEEAEIKQARNEYNISLKLATKCCYIAKPLAIMEYNENNEISIEMLYEYGGQSLQKYTGTLAAPELIAIARKTLEPLVLLEAEGVFHSDIKPDNYVIKNRVVKLIDFGVSRDFASRTQVLEVRNTISTKMIGFTGVYCPQNYSCKLKSTLLAKLTYIAGV